MLLDLQSLSIQRFVPGGTNPITGESIPVAGCIPLATAITGITVTTNPVNSNQLDITGTITTTQIPLFQIGNYISIGGVARKIKSINNAYLSVTLDYPWPVTLTVQSIGICVKSKYRLVQISNTGSSNGILREVIFAANQAESISNSAGVEVIGYDATGTTYEITVGI